MSVSGLSGSSFLSYDNQNVQNSRQQVQQEFQQLGQDLESGNLSAAQQDFATLQQLGPQSSSTTSASSKSPLAQDLQQLSQDLQSGNISAAQQDYTKVQQDFQKHAAQGHHHHHHGGSGSSQMSQLFDQLGQALQSGNLSAAEQAYNSLMQNLQQFSQTPGSSSQTNTGGLSVNG